MGIDIKRVIAVALILTITLTGCTVRFAVEPTDPSELPVANGGQQSGDSGLFGWLDADELQGAGKIVIITNPYIIDEDAFLVANEFANRFGQERVVHIIWPRLEMVSDIPVVLQEISEDPEVGALIVNSSIWDNQSVIDALRDIREDIFVVYTPLLRSERPIDIDIDIKADLIIQTDMQRLGESYVTQAISMGADTIVSYTFPRIRAISSFAIHRDAMKAVSERNGISYVEIEAPDPYYTLYQHYLPMFITQDLPRQVERLGINTAFFAMACPIQATIISRVIATGAIFVNTCCPSPYRSFPEAVGIETEIPTSENDEHGVPIIRRLELSELLHAIDEEIDAVGMAGRISCSAVSDSMMWTTIGFLYALEWLNENVSRESDVIDVEVLRRLASEYMVELGVAAGVALEPLTHDGHIIGHYILGVMDHHVFG